MSDSPPFGEDPSAIAPRSSEAKFFALTPAQSVTDTYDFSLLRDSKIYTKATEPFNTRHAGTASTLRLLLDELEERVREFDWNTLIWIEDTNGISCNLLTQSRMLTIEDCSRSASQYIGTKTKTAQNNHMMFQSLIRSLTPEGLSAIKNSSHSYLLNGQPSACMLIKAMLMDCEVENKATNFYIREQMSNLKHKILELEYDIIAFNSYAMELRRQLERGGENSSDLFMHVFRAYLSCKDKDFVAEMRDCKRRYNHGESISLTQLMITAQTTYQALIQEGTYNAPSPEEAQIIALTAALAGKLKQDKEHAKHTSKSKKAKGHNRDRPPCPAWMSVPPTNGQTTKTVDGKQYHFCTVHNRWGQHKEEDCNLRRRQQADGVTHTAMPATTTPIPSGDSTHLGLSNDQNIQDEEQSYISFPSIATSRSKPSSHSPTPFDSDSFLIMIDNGASKCMTNNLAHFVGNPRVVSKQVKGLGNGIISKQGTILWTWEDDSGKIHKHYINNALYCKELPFCLLSPQHLAREIDDNYPKKNGTWLATYDNHMTLYWGQQQFHRTIPLSPNTSGVAFMRSAPSYTRSSAFLKRVTAKLPTCTGDVCFSTLGHVLPSATPDTTEVDSKGPAQSRNTNLRLLRIHYRLGHLSFKAIQKMALNGQLPAEIAKLHFPKCTACMFSKASRRAWRTRHAMNSHIQSSNCPGAIISVDQIESSTPGLIVQSKGLHIKSRYTCATIFVDHFSRLSFVHLQTSTDGPSTLAAKYAFERFAQASGHKVSHYHGDNGRFSEHLFTTDCTTKGQTVSLCGVNAHFQNGIIERRIRDLQDRARTMLIHATYHWPNAITANLWPYALRLANETSQLIPTGPEGKTPLELFTGVRPSKGAYLLPFGCPVYVLNAAQANGKKGPKWSERSKCGIYLGTSPHHARSVGLILSLETGYASPQFHFQADELFETVSPSHVTPSHSMPFPSLWQKKTGLSTQSKPHLSSPVFNHSSPTPVINRLGSNGLDVGVNSNVNLEALNLDSEDEEESDLQHNRKSRDNQETINIAPKEQAQDPSPMHSEVLPEIARTRPFRHIRAPRRLIEEISMSALQPMSESENVYSELGEHLIQEELMDPVAFAATSDQDTMYLHEAKKQTDWDKFRQAMHEEVIAHEVNRHWSLIPKHLVPTGVKVLPSVWSFKRKRRISTQEVYKWKARLTAHGGKQEKGVNYWETYSPVVNWASIRFHLALAVLNKHYTQQIDFVLAYPQADAECDIYMSIPQGFSYNGQRGTHVLKLLKNIYGTKQAGRIWNKHIHSGLIERGYVQSSSDPCVYYIQDTVFLLYVDDGIFIGPNLGSIKSLIASLQSDPRYKTSYNITDEGALNDYLGVQIRCQRSGEFLLTQPHLIQQILNDLGFKENTKPKNLPALTTKALHKDPDGPAFEEAWSYRSIIGKLNFLEKSTRPDIAFAVHQCARFTAFPKQSHANAVRQIGRYLLGTKDKGMIWSPTEHSFDCYVDSDFCGTWEPTRAQSDSSTARSRSGYVIKYAGCPLVWHSKLQSEIALSTTEAEYIALSMALREVISLICLAQEAKAQGLSKVLTQPSVHCCVFEDNNGALEMAKVHKLRPRTKHLNVKYHHFREHVNKGTISLHPISSSQQEADIFTKPLGSELFNKFRNKILGW